MYTHVVAGLDPGRDLRVRDEFGEEDLPVIYYNIYYNNNYYYPLPLYRAILVKDGLCPLSNKDVPRICSVCSLSNKDVPSSMFTA